MNGADVCHEVDGCPGLLVDAFRGKYLQRTQDPNDTFILTHYHGDHYQNLPREGKYQGPALIHCTPVTAALLIKVHEVPEAWVIAHEYGHTWKCKVKGKGKEEVRITFYDANHCPGACIVVIQLADGTTHLHTGDMRYHERFKSYPVLQDAVRHNRLDMVYLDTTYSHPKHDFVPQEDAVQSIAGTVEELLGSGDSAMSTNVPKTLILLSCYSIGKEKVLWETSTRTNQLVYVNEKKHRMLECVKGHESEEVSSQIINRCTLDPNKTCIHVIPMGLAGELWPFFRPNFLKCATYAHELQQGYEKVVAFLPTGWAHGSKWNREHAVTQKTVTDEVSASIDVEVRLIPYSEHSAFSELVSFVQYLRPRKVIPTVFSDDADYRKIEHRFRNLLDTKRAKQAFFRSMEQQPKKEKLVDNHTITVSSPFETSHEDTDVLYESTSSEDYVEVVNGPIIPGVNRTKADSEGVATLVAMGFSTRKARSALVCCSGDLRGAVDRLLGLNANRSIPTVSTPSSTIPLPGDIPSTPRSTASGSYQADKKRKTPPSTANDVTITSFFAKRKQS